MRRLPWLLLGVALGVSVVPTLFSEDTHKAVTCVMKDHSQKEMRDLRGVSFQLSNVARGVFSSSPLSSECNTEGSQHRSVMQP